jgi:uncharacterized phage infection (PIP) family protein YhgE
VLIAIGVVGTLAWQSYGVQAKQVVAARAPEYGLDWVVPWVDRIPTAVPAPVVASAPAATPAPAASPAPAVSPPQAAMSAPARDVSAETSKQLESLTADVAALRKSVEQLAARPSAGAGNDLKDVQQSIQQIAAKQDDIVQHNLKDVRDSLQQLSTKQEQMAQQPDLAAVKQSVEQLAAKQDQMMTELGKLQSTEQNAAPQNGSRRRR